MVWAGPIAPEQPTLFEGDHPCDHVDHARDRSDRTPDLPRPESFERKPGYQYARNYPDPFTGEPLQVYPPKPPSDFDSLDDWALHSEAVNRWSNGLPPPRPKPTGEAIRPSVGTPRAPRSTRGRALKSRFVGMRMGQADFELLEELAHAHSVPVGTMARILVVRGVRAAADPRQRRRGPPPLEPERAPPDGP